MAERDFERDIAMVEEVLAQERQSLTIMEQRWPAEILAFTARGVGRDYAELRGAIAGHEAMLERIRASQAEWPRLLQGLDEPH